MTLFSIIIPIYNVSPYLKDCLDSVLRQTCTSWEAICVDDGSQDGSSAILDEYAARDTRFKVKHIANGGVSHARNIALAEATGCWLVFIDGDDIVSSNLLEILQSCSLLEDGCEAMYYRYSRFQEGEKPDFSASNIYLSFDTTKVVPSQLLKACNMNCWGVALKYERVRNIRFKKYICGEDRLYCLESLLALNKVIILDARIYGYRIRRGSYVESPMTMRKLRDEVGYRLEFSQIVSMAPKKIDLKEVDWMEVFFKHSYLSYLQRLKQSERAEAWRLWYSTLPTLLKIRGFTRLTKICLLISSCARVKFVSLLCCRYLPAIAARLQHINWN